MGIDVEKVDASLAGLEQLIQDIKSDQRVRKIQSGRAGRKRWAAALSRERAAAFSREREARAAELKQRGVRNPFAQAEKEIAEREDFASGPAFNRWLRRHR